MLITRSPGYPLDAAFESIKYGLLILSYQRFCIPDRMYAIRGPVIKERKRAADAAKSLNDNAPITAQAMPYTYQVSTQPPSPRPKRKLQVTLPSFPIQKRPYSPSPFLTSSRTLFSYSGLRSLQIFAASTFAGLSSFGSASMLITEIKIFSTLWIGDHRSEACS